METLHQKTEAALQLLRRLKEEFAAPVIFFSGGKDSMVLLDLCRRAGYYAVPCISFTEEWLPRKWAFLRHVAQLWDLEIIEYPPLGAWINETEGKFVMGATWQTGAGNVELPWDVQQPPPEAMQGNELAGPYRCGMKWMSRRTGGVDWQWDLILIGHKDVDTDPVIGPVPLKVDHVPPPDGQPATTWFPLRGWTDADIWAYTTARNLPVDWRRYQQTDGLPIDRETPENPDTMHACVHCLKQCHAGQEVRCPATGEMMPALADRVPRLAALRKPYFGTTAAAANP